ncbi:sodium- and chloride-dependent GABA transporter ine-like isoform X1 [Periplaneta americana]|uniref:sodium- and chloride-dependent GABA transporter ine-like isoform X1 n=1 Tax=Periplaneta americana TaxID=6978 RepID=UPI0037E72D83
MDLGGKGASSSPQRGPQIPLIAQEHPKHRNMIGAGDDSPGQSVKRPKLTLVISKAENDNMSHASNKNYDKVHDRNEENRRLLGTGSASQKKIMIVPSVHQGAVVPANGVKQTVINNDSVTVSASSPHNGTVQKTEDSKFQNKYGNGGLRPPPFVTGLELSGLDKSIRAGHTLPLTMSSLRSLKLEDANGHQPIISPTGHNWSSSFCFSEVASHMSVRSLASIGMGSTDGRKVTIRRVPTSPTELFNIVHSPTPTELDLSSDSDSSYYDPLDELADYRLPRRQHWSNKAQFVLACVGYCVGLGNLWRFPYLCYKSGGGVFLVPYFLILIICGIPLLYMELAVGQFTRRGPIGALGQICPLFKGAGLASVVISFIMSTYYNVIIAYALYYFFTAFKSDAPWSSCLNRWNTNSCWTSTGPSEFTKPNISKTPSEEFYERKVLQISDGIDNPGVIRWELAACLIFAWILVYFSIWKSVKSSGKVLYFTATFPYVLILAFLAHSLTLEGSDEGLKYFFKPRWSLLKDSKVWVNAAAQNFNSLGIAFGSVISFASYNRFSNQILVDTLAVSTINGVTSILVGIFAFATIGNIATEQGTAIEDVVSDGPGLIFVVYPQAMAKMPAPQLWAVLFFFMLLCLGLNSQFAIVEVVVTSIQDGFPKLIKKHLMCHEMLVLVVVMISFFFGLPHITEGGMYFFQLVDHFAASISIMYLAFFEVIAISWFYGGHRLAKNVEEMTGRLPSPYIRFCWWVAAPALLMAVWVFSLIDYTPPTYNNGAYEYPLWAETLGWIIASLSLICIPALAVIVILRTEGNSIFEKLRNSVKSDIHYCETCGQEKCRHINTNSKEEEREMSTLIDNKIDTQIVPSNRS